MQNSGSIDTDARLQQQVMALALEASDLSEYSEGVVKLLQRAVGADRIMAVAATQSGWRALYRERVSSEHLERLHSGWTTFRDELKPVMTAARRDGVAIDRNVLGPRLERSQFYREVIVPQQGHSSLFAMLISRQGTHGSLILGRSRCFSQREQEFVAKLVPALSLGAAVFRSQQGAPLARACAWLPSKGVSDRDREVIDYVCLGYTNPEIALACGVSRNTVRNRLARIFEVLDVSTRAELVSRSTGRLP